MSREIGTGAEEEQMTLRFSNRMFAFALIVAVIVLTALALAFGMRLRGTSVTEGHLPRL